MLTIALLVILTARVEVARSETERQIKNWAGKIRTGLETHKHPHGRA